MLLKRVRPEATSIETFMVLEVSIIFRFTLSFSLLPSFSSTLEIHIHYYYSGMSWQYFLTYSFKLHCRNERNVYCPLYDLNVTA